MVQCCSHGDLSTIDTGCTAMLANAGLILLLGFAPCSTLNCDFSGYTCQHFGSQPWQLVAMADYGSLDCASATNFVRQFVHTCSCNYVHAECDMKDYPRIADLLGCFACVLSSVSTPALKAISGI